MTRRNLVALACMALVSVATATFAYATSQASLTGSWTITVETPQGAMESTWELEQTDDGALKGVTSNDMMGEQPFEGGWVDDDAFGFEMYVEAQGQGIDVVYEGTFTENEMSGVLSVGGGQFTADFTGVREDGGTR